MSADQTPEPAVGQVWADNDPRSAGRAIYIESINWTARYAVCRPASNRQGRRTRVALRRLRPTSNGYRYLRTEGGAPDA